MFRPQPLSQTKEVQVSRLFYIAVGVLIMLTISNWSTVLSAYHSFNGAERSRGLGIIVGEFLQGIEEGKQNENSESNN